MLDAHDPPLCLAWTHKLANGIGLNQGHPRATAGGVLALLPCWRSGRLPKFRSTKTWTRPHTSISSSTKLSSPTRQLCFITLPAVCRVSRLQRRAATHACQRPLVAWSCRTKGSFYHFKLGSKGLREAGAASVLGVRVSGLN